MNIKVVVLLYADDILILAAESEELLVENLRQWKKGMEKKDLKSECWKYKGHEMTG